MSKLSVLPLIICAVLLSGAALFAQAQYPKIRAELLAMEKVDQDARTKCTNGTADQQVKCLGEISKTIDEPNTKRIIEIFNEIGFPNTAKVGKDGLQAYMILLQHASSDDLRVKSLDPITAAFKNKEIMPVDYANFVDRLRCIRARNSCTVPGLNLGTVRW